MRSFTKIFITPFLLCFCGLVTPTVLAREIKILAFGDSLTAGYQLAADAAYPKQLEKMLNEKKFTVKVVNAGVSGDTSAQGLKRVDWVLKSGPFDIILLCLGGNDGLRLLPVKDMKKNLELILDKFQKTKAQIVFIGMKVPTNSDPKYTKDFEAVFPGIAKKKKLIFVPFLLEGVAASELLNLDDQIHPNPKGHQIIAENLMKTILPLVKKLH